jgi:hypothetical protein
MSHERESTRDPWSEHLATVSGLPVVAGSSPPPEALRAARPGTSSPDLELWRAALGLARLEVPGGDGPLHPWSGTGAIEVWTEEELSALHALWRLARLRSHAGARARALSAARWHLEHTQPDNATNRPWALHVFLIEGSAEARAYAGTLLHNALAMEGRATALSAWILMDAAAELRLVSVDGAGG